MRPLTLGILIATSELAITIRQRKKKRGSRSRKGKTYNEASTIAAPALTSDHMYACPKLSRLTFTCAALIVTSRKTGWCGKHFGVREKNCALQTKLIIEAVRTVVRCDRHRRTVVAIHHC